MKRNVGTIDRVLRIVIALVIGVLLITGQLGGALAVILAIVALILLVTGLAGSCPLYAALGFSTCPRKASG
ncbi:YgaP family membrane protein [Rhodothermus marinus]|uniref:YgaP family membrane protein n=1 Tax=Rhodothermus marinus TaxID=29549 RepID=UPI0006D210E3|nr:DUF2892 domain-containing protein [Rhodothermus marinus]